MRWRSARLVASTAVFTLKSRRIASALHSLMLAQRRHVTDGEVMVKSLDSALSSFIDDGKLEAEPRFGKLA